MKTKSRKLYGIIAACLALIVIGAVAGHQIYTAQKAKTEKHDSTLYAMDTIITQTAYGPRATEAMVEVNRRIQAFENQLSLYSIDSEVAQINAAAGKGGAMVSAETANLIVKSIDYGAQSENSFAITIAPLTLAWGVTNGAHNVLSQEEINALLPLVDDSKIQVEFSDDGKTARVTLEEEGMAIDLGGIAKGDVCRIAQEVYEEYGVESANISIGGNVYAHGVKPDGTSFRIGFRTPVKGATSYIAIFELTDTTVAVSSGEERNFEDEDGTYIHIIDPRDGRPATSDILAIGVVHEDGAIGDYYSTALYVLGRDKALEYMQNGITCILLDQDNNLYVSKSLEDGFSLVEATADNYTLTFIEGS